MNVPIATGESCNTGSHPGTSDTQPIPSSGAHPWRERLAGFLVTLGILGIVFLYWAS